MRVVYRLKNDRQHITTETSCDLPVHTCRGTITKCYLGSMKDWPEFTMCSDSGETTSWGRFGHSGEDDRYYQVGRRIEVDYVLEPLRPGSLDPRTERKTVLEVRIEAQRESI